MLSRKFASVFFSVLISLGSVFFSPTLKAATEIGNGGFGVKVGDRLYLQDLFEAGLHANPVYSTHPSQKKYFAEVVAKSIGGLEEISFAVQDSVSAKLEEIEAVDRVFAYTIALALQSYSWRMVTIEWDDPLDSGGVLNGVVVEFVKLALRSGKMVRIHKDHWNQLDDGNKTALIFHEMIYALLRQNPQATKEQLSQQARSLTSYLFSRDLRRLGLSGLKRAVGDSWFFGDGHAAILKDEIIDFEKTVTYSWSRIDPIFGRITEARTHNWDASGNNHRRAHEYCAELASVASDVDFYFGQSALQLIFSQPSSGQGELAQENLEVYNNYQAKLFSTVDLNEGSTCVSKVEAVLNAGEKSFDKAL